MGDLLEVDFAEGDFTARGLMEGGFVGEDFELRGVVGCCGNAAAE